MKMNEEKAKKLFLEQFPDGIGYDFARRKMKLEDYGNDKVKTGWNIDHILAISKGGTNAKCNLQCTNIKTNTIKQSKTTWLDNNVRYQVRKNKGLYTIIKVDENENKKEYNLNDKAFVLSLFKQRYPLGVGFDLMGRKMILEDYSNKDVYSGWNIVKLNPKNTKINDERNYEIFNIVSILEKNNKTSWIDNDRYFQIKRSNGRFKVVEVIHKEGVTFKKGELCYGFN